MMPHSCFKPAVFATVTALTIITMVMVKGDNELIADTFSSYTLFAGVALGARALHQGAAAYSERRKNEQNNHSGNNSNISNPD